MFIYKRKYCSTPSSLFCLLRACLYIASSILLLNFVLFFFVVKWNLFRSTVPIQLDRSHLTHAMHYVNWCKLQKTERVVYCSYQGTRIDISMSSLHACTTSIERERNMQESRWRVLPPWCVFFLFFSFLPSLLFCPSTVTYRRRQEEEEKEGQNEMRQGGGNRSRAAAAATADETRLSEIDCSNC